MIIQVEVTTVYKFDKSITKLNAKELRKKKKKNPNEVRRLDNFYLFYRRKKKKNRLDNRS